MIDYTEQIKTLEEIEETQEQDLLTAIQLIFFLNPLFYRRALVKRSRFRLKKPCFDLMEFEDEEFFTIREKENGRQLALKLLSGPRLVTMTQEELNETSKQAQEEFLNKHCQKCQRPLYPSNPNTLCLECKLPDEWF